MKRFAQQLKKQSDSVKLRASERRELRERLVSYMEYHPASDSVVATPSPSIFSKFSILKLNTFEGRSFMGALSVLLLITVPVLAERAVPGDALYAFKINVNEEIRSSLSVSPYAKVEWETERLNRRIAEARLLASEGRLTEEAEADVAAAVKHHSDEAQKEIAVLRASDSDEAAIAEIAFESALVVQSEILEKELAKEVALNVSASTTPGRSVAILAGAIAEAKTSATANQSGVMPSYEKLSIRMEQETTRAYELFDSIEGAASDEEVSDVRRRLSDVERKIEEAQAIHSGEKTATATASTTPNSNVFAEVALLKIALSDVQKLIRFMTDIDVRGRVTVEDLVPVTLTTDERVENINKRSAEIGEELTSLRAVVEQKDLAVATKSEINTQIAAVEQLLEATASAMQEENLAAAEEKLAEAEGVLGEVKAKVESANSLEIDSDKEVEKSTTTDATSTDSVIKASGTVEMVL